MDQCPGPKIHQMSQLCYYQRCFKQKQCFKSVTCYSYTTRYIYVNSSRHIKFLEPINQYEKFEAKIPRPFMVMMP